MKLYGILLFCLGLLVCGCQSSKPPAQKIASARITILNEPSTLDPHQARDIHSLTIVRLLFDGLTRVGKTEKAELALAKSVSYSQDMKTYTFFLRDAKWSNDDSVTAQDFAYAWKKLLDPQYPSDIASYLYILKNAKAIKEGKLKPEALGVRVVDDKTLEVELEHSAPYFLELVAFPAFFPVNARFEAVNPNWAQSAASYVCNGPFRLREWKHSDRIVVEKNSTYWDAHAVELKELEIVVVNDEDTALKMFEKKELDWTGSPLSTLPVESINALRKQNILKTKEMLATYFIRVNTEHSLLKDARIRRALAMAIDRKEIVEHVTQGNQIPATGLVPLSFGLQEEPYFTDGAIPEARSLFLESMNALQVDKKAFEELTLFYSATQRNHLIAQAVQQQWNKVFGIRVKLESCENKVYFDRIKKQNYELAIGSWVADFNDPINFLDVFRYKTEGLNNTHWENSQYAELLRRSEIEANPIERLNLLKESEKLLIAEMPILPIFYFTMLYGQQSRLEDVILSSMGVLDFKWAKVAESTK
ncbi:MAG TPA: peptide ABC transporter substrate-binding protein [Rhabdochlamydiaceae bacterium]|jgi:oligopeptide transport system substrate-binding protein